ncbi:2TM domain-containing protein [Glaciihabitans tibetensis]|uniref:2TM domain-containing protein n=1 Tax=Glaciihabitans tibetensis TaxID=1266600 RepID=A0A2T0V4D4_9MICO|nr:2TM domain-containing protein [Glaciihabitans tibetensis]PRY65046.1 2TM domain-containing protein [Glaciihabitans tibetensis]
MGDDIAGQAKAGPTSAGTTDERDWARKKIQRRRELATHATAYVVVNLFLVLTWWFSGGGYFWPGWVIAGWGVGLVLDAASVLIPKEITEDQIDRELKNRKR